MQTIARSTRLAAPIAVIWAHAQRPALLHYVSRGVMAFDPLDPPRFPDRWAARDYRVRLRWKGVLPVGEQIIAIEYPDPDGAVRYLRDNGRSASIKRWDHLVTLTPVGDSETHYEDRLHLDAGVLTAPTALFAERFYAHRQKRWRKLVASNFQDPEYRR